jgi:hypothetical protein
MVKRLHFLSHIHFFVTCFLSGSFILPALLSANALAALNALPAELKLCSNKLNQIN